MIYELVKPASLTDVWVQTEPKIKRALKHANGELTAEDIRRAVARDQIKLFIAHDKTTVHAVLCCELVTYPRYTSLNIIVAAGGAHTVADAQVDFIPWLRTWAKAQGVEKFEARCHPSMARLLQRYGFYHQYAVMMQDLE